MLEVNLSWHLSGIHIHILTVATRLSVTKAMFGSASQSHVWRPKVVSPQPFGSYNL